MKFDTIGFLKILGDVVEKRQYSLVLDGDKAPMRSAYNLFNHRGNEKGTIMIYPDYLKVLKGNDTKIFKPSLKDDAGIVELADKVFLYLTENKSVKLINFCNFI